MTDLDVIITHSSNESDVNVSGVSVKAKTKTKKPNEYPNLTNHILEHITTVAHTCIVGFVAFILFLSFKDPVFLFTWHPVLYGIGWMLFMTEAVLMISKDNIYSRRISHLLTVRWHWILQVLAVALSVGGFLAVYLFNERFHYSHFKTWHAWSGLLSMIFCIPVCLNGVAALFNVELRQYISPKKNKFFHATTGILTCSLGGVAMITSIYTDWFGQVTGGNEPLFYMSLITAYFGIGWSLFRPLITFCQRLKSFF